MKRGPRPQPALQLVREGHTPKPSIVVPEGELPEPDWLETWPATRDKVQQRVNARAREVARREWRRVVPVLIKAAGLGGVDAQILLDYCICVAQLDEANRDLATRGMLIQGERGWQKNGYTTIAAQLRTQLARYIGELGLSPSARTRLTPPKGAGDDEGDPFGESAAG